MELVQPRDAVLDLEAELVAIYPDLIRRLSLVLRSVEDAEDVAQAAFANAFEHRGRFRGGDLKAWFYTIGLRLAFNELRRRRRARVEQSFLDPEWALRTDPDLWRALSELDPQHRAALLLAELDGYTHAEVAQILKVPPGTVSSWLARTKQQLRITLGGNND